MGVTSLWDTKSLSHNRVSPEVRRYQNNTGESADISSVDCLRNFRRRQLPDLAGSAYVGDSSESNSMYVCRPCLNGYFRWLTLIIMKPLRESSPGFLWEKPELHLIKTGVFPRFVQGPFPGAGLIVI